MPEESKASRGGFSSDDLGEIIPGVTHDRSMDPKEEPAEEPQAEPEPAPTPAKSPEVVPEEVPAPAEPAHEGV